MRNRKKKTRGVITSCSGSVNINDNRNKTRKKFLTSGLADDQSFTVNDDDDWTVINMSDQ